MSVVSLDFTMDSVRGRVVQKEQEGYGEWISHWAIEEFKVCVEWVKSGRKVGQGNSVAWWENALKKTKQDLSLASKMTHPFPFPFFVVVL